MLLSNSAIITDASNNVGIGTTPSYKLDVSGTSNATTLSVAGAVTLRTGSGSPEGVVTATVGSQYFRTDGSVGTTLYIKQTGSGNTGWTAMNSAASLTSVTNGTSNMTVALNAEITFTTAGSERARVTPSGQLAIGETTPTGRVHLKGAGGNDASLWVESTTNTDGRITFKNTLGQYSIGLTGATTGDWLHYDSTNAHTVHDYKAGASGYHRLFTNNTERVRIDSSGNVGIGTNGPNEKLEVAGAGLFTAAAGSTNRNGLILDRSSTVSRIISGATDSSSTTMQFWTASAGTEANRMTLGATGVLGLTSGGTRAVGSLSPAGHLHIEDSGSDPKGIALVRNSNDTAGASIALGKSRGASASSFTTVNSGDELGEIEFVGSDGTVSTSIAAKIGAYVAATPSTTSMPGYISFQTTPVGSVLPTERLRLSSTGNLEFKSSASSEQQVIWELTGRNVYLYARDSDDRFGLYDSVLAANRWYTDTTGNFVAAGDVTAFSDARLKTDVQRIGSALNKVSQINGYTYTRTDTGARQAGVIAQEVLKVLPEVVKDDGTQLSVAYGNMVGLLIEAIKELSDKVVELQQKVK